MQKRTEAFSGASRSEADERRERRRCVIDGRFVTLLGLGEGDDAVLVGVEERHVLLQVRRPGLSAAARRRRRLAPCQNSSE